MIRKGWRKRIAESFNIGRIRLTAFIALAAVVMVLLLLLWAEKSSVDHVVINDKITSKSTLGNTTVYTLNVSDIDETNNYSLHFKSYGNTICIKADEIEIYTYGQDYAQRHLDIGRIYVSAPLPKDTNLIKIELTASDCNASQQLAKIDLCAAEDTGRYYLSNDTLGFPMALIYSVLGVFSITASVAIAVIGKEKHIRNTFLFLGLTLTCMAVELADTGGHYLVLFEDQYTWNIIFYFVSYIIPISASCYGYSVLGDRFPIKQRKIAYIGVWISIAYGIIATVLPLTTSLRFCDLYVWYQYSLVLSVAFGCYSAVYVLRKGIIRKSAVPFLVAGLIWGIVAVILSYANFLTISTTAVTPMDIESLESILLLNFLGMTMIFFLKNEMDKIQAERIKVFQLKNELQTMRYKVFASQMQPHFLYNALSSIRQIIHEDANYASALLADFTVHLRGTIRAMSNDQPISFADELKNIEAYVHIEKMRFEERLAIRYEIQAKDFQIIPLSIQPLVENAIQHGIYNKGEDGGTVTLRTVETSAAWIIEVLDDGAGFDVDAVLKKVENGEKDSTGLRNLVFRLENLMQAKVTINSKIGVGTHITVTIPKRNGKEHEGDYC